MKQIKTTISQSNLWQKIRYVSILHRHAKVAAFWKPILQEYVSGNIASYAFKPKVDLGSQKIIWQYWGQGFDRNSLPEIVNRCADSVDQFMGDYTIIRLSDDTVKEYLDFPDCVYHKLNSGIFSRTFFSDLLRVCLLATYGGVWLDATIFLTDKLPQKYADTDFFLFQRDDDELHKNFWEKSYAYYWGWNKSFKVRMLSSVFYAKKGTKPICVMRDLLMYYWLTQNKLHDYFVFQILFNELVDEHIIENCPIVNDTLPHILQTKINGSYDWITLDELLKLTSIHKMSYFSEEGIRKLNEMFPLES